MSRKYATPADLRCAQLINMFQYLLTQYTIARHCQQKQSDIQLVLVCDNAAVCDRVYPLWQIPASSEQSCLPRLRVRSHDDRRVIPSVMPLNILAAFVGVLVSQETRAILNDPGTIQLFAAVSCINDKIQLTAGVSACAAPRAQKPIHVATVISDLSCGICIARDTQVTNISSLSHVLEYEVCAARPGIAVPYSKKQHFVDFALIPTLPPHFENRALCDGVNHVEHFLSTFHSVYLKSDRRLCPVLSVLVSVDAVQVITIALKRVNTDGGPYTPCHPESTISLFDSKTQRFLDDVITIKELCETSADDVQRKLLSVALLPAVVALPPAVVASPVCFFSASSAPSVPPSVPCGYCIVPKSGPGENRP